MELEPEERERILLEERYRYELRQKLSEIKSDGPWKKFLNSSFGLWLLSAVFVSGAGTLYQHWQKKFDEDKAVFQKKLDETAASREAISRLDVEISYRLSAALLELSSVADRVKTQYSAKTEQEQKLVLAQSTFAILQDLNSKDRAARNSLYPELSSYALPTLLAELRRRLPTHERPSVETSLASFASITSSMQFKNDTAPPRQAAEALFQTVILKRWQGTAFHYIDCDAKNPFC